jgi:hypothetical protein
MGFGHTLTVDIRLMNMRAALRGRGGGAVGYNIYFKKEKRKKERKKERNGLSTKLYDFGRTLTVDIGLMNMR